MTFDATATGSSQKNRYRLPGIEREGIAQLSLLETALWPLGRGQLFSPRFETSYSFATPVGRQNAEVTVRSAIGLQPIDEFILWGLLGVTLQQPEPNEVLLAKPSWLLKQLGMDIGGSQYTELRNSLLRLSTTSYQNSGFFNPETQEHEWVSFQFLSILLPTVGGLGGPVDNNRLWRIEWNPAFYRFSKVTGGNLLFDLDLYRELTPASRRLFLKLQDRFWRAKKVFLNVDDLTTNGLGFSATRPLKKRKYDLTNCIQELLDHKVIELGRGQTTPQDLFIRHGKGSYVVVLYKGEYFRTPISERSTRQQNAIKDDPLYDELKKFGVDDAAIRRLFRQSARSLIQRWLRITDAAMNEKPRGFPGFKKSPAAYLMDGVQQNRLPPDWMHAHEKLCRQQQWERDHAKFAQDEQERRRLYEQDRAKAFQDYICSPEGQQHYSHAYPILEKLYQLKEPDRVHDATHEAILARIEREYFRFPDYAEWAIRQQNEAIDGGL